MTTLTIRIKTTALENLKKNWKLFRKMPDTIYPHVDEIGDAITRVARQITAPRFKGTLAFGIDYEIVKTKNGNSLSIFNYVPYSYFQEAGFRPHFVKITPYVKKWLEAHKTGEAGHRPGKKGYIFVKKFTPHIEPAIEIVRPNIDTILKNGVDDFLSKTFGGIK